jgi:predicted dehydrogenase
MAVDAVVIGAGNRGRLAYGRWALAHPERLRVVAIAEPHAGRREAMAAEHGLGAGRSHADWRPLLGGARLGELAIVATGDGEHVGPALAALAAGYHLLLEKPIALAAADCARVVEAAERAGRVLQVAHVLRYTPFLAKVIELAAGGALGEIVHVDMREHVAAWHYAHSYVRGKFRSLASAAPILLAKSCHDLDVLAWLVGRPAARVASHGGLAHYRRESAPAGAPARCSEGCPVQPHCAHDAERFYLAPDDALARIWPWSDLGLDPARAERRAALEKGPYGRCVYRCDNEVADHQSVALEFEGGASASFALDGFAAHERRTLRIAGTRAELRGVLQEGVIELSRIGRLERERFETPASALDHYGGDSGLLEALTDALARGDASRLRGAGREALESHLIGFAAERARESGRWVELAEFRREALGAAG